MIKFGGSTRLHILKGPDEDKEDELPMPVKKPNPVDEDDGNCLWGIGKDVRNVSSTFVIIIKKLIYNIFSF